MGKRKRKRSAGLTPPPDAGVANRIRGSSAPLWAILVLVQVTFVVYYNSLHNAFVFDDQDWILAPQKMIRQRGSLAFRSIVRASYAIDYAISGGNPWGYHLSNIAYHALSAVFVFLIARTLFDRIRPALFAGLLFAVHPVLTECVAYLSGRRDALSGLFVLMGFYAFLRYRRTDRALYLGLALLAYLLGFFSKETAIILPLLCFSYDVVSRIRVEGPGVPRPREVWISIRAAFLQGRWLYLPLLVLAGGLAFYVLFLVRGTWMRSYHAGSFWFTMLTVARVFVHYIALFIFPLTLNADYSYNAFPLTTSWTDPRALAAVLMLLALGYGLLRLLKRRPLATFGGAWFFIALLPASHIIPTWELVAEHYLYVPAAGFCLVVVALADPLLDRPRLAPALYAAGIVVLLLLSLRTVRRNADWKDDLTLWQKTVQDAPQVVRARTNLGAVHLRRGELVQAEEQLQAALAIDPKYSPALGNLGKLYLQQGDLVRAEQALTTAAIRSARRRPGKNQMLGVMHLWLGEVYARMGRMVEAEEEVRAAVSTTEPPYDAYAYNNLGTLLAETGRMAEAESAFKEALHRMPNMIESRDNLARLSRHQAHSEPAADPMKRVVP